MSSRAPRPLGTFHLPFSPAAALAAPVLGLLALVGRVEAVGGAHSDAPSPDQLTGEPVFLTQLGGKSSDQATGVATDAEGFVFVTGWTRSGDFPTSAEAFDGHVDQRDAFVAKLSPDGSQLIWSTVLGGARDEEALAVILLEKGAVLVGGWTSSDDFPTTEFAHRRQRLGRRDGFLTALDARRGDILFSTFVGGSGDDEITGIAQAPDGDLALTGRTESRDLPTLEYSLQSQRGGKSDAFVLRLDGEASLLRFATYLGGKGKDSGVAIAFDAEGYMTVAGTTQSSDFPVTAGALDTSRGASDVFVARITPEGRRLVYSTFFGGNRDESAHAMTLAPDGGAVVVGVTRSDDLSALGAGAVARSGRRDGFVFHLSNSGGALIFSRYLGGSGDDSLGAVSMDGLGNLWVAGRTESDDLLRSLPGDTGSRGGAGDGFLAELDVRTGAANSIHLVGGRGDEELWGLASDDFHGGVAFVGRAQRTERGLRGPFAGAGGASDALVGRLLSADCSVVAQVIPRGSQGAGLLDAGLPRLGEGFLVTLESAESTRRGLFFLGAPAAFPLEVEGLGTLFLDPRAAIPVRAFTTDGNGTASMALGIPESPELCGLRIVIQALVDGQASSAVELVLGS